MGEFGMGKLKVREGKNVRSTNVFDECSSNESPMGDVGVEIFVVREGKKREEMGR